MTPLDASRAIAQCGVSLTAGLLLAVLAYHGSGLATQTKLPVQV
ncbi:hypothetical protein ACF3DV_05060 [Chlorogloeopsis fritschii PCC 9212]|nr:hypothetical protein [Chlorogloeopsis fritschii]